MKPHVICHMMGSLDGGLHASCWTESPDGDVRDWSSLYERVHDALDCDAWIVGRVTMAEMSKADAHPPADFGAVERPVHIAKTDADTYAIAIDRSGKLHFDGGDVGGDATIVLLGRDVSDAHLAELTADEVSYVVSEGDDIDLAAAFATLASAFGIERLALEGGAGINGSVLAAGLVDELSVIVAPAIDGRHDMETIFDAGTDGLKGRVRLSLTRCETLAHGVVHLRYDVEG